MTDYEVQDGYKDQLSGESISFHREDEPWSVGIKTKTPGSTFSIPSDIRAWVDAVDFGTVGGFRQTVPASAVCGDYVVLYFKPVDENTQVRGIQWSSFLSQIDELQNAFPPNMTYENYEPIVVKSPNFKAPKGIFNGMSYYYPEFIGSTFSVGPRIYGEIAMSMTLTWPPTYAFDTSVDRAWEPFAGCPNVVKIEFQGTLGEYCEKIYPSKLVYKDENGYERVEAYPDGGRPKVISGAIVLDSFQMDSGSKFPQWDCSQLEICVSPVFANEIVLPTRSGTISLPIGPDVSKSNNLRHYFNGIKNVVRGEDPDRPFEKQESPLIFGLKLLGIDLPESVDRAVDSYKIWRHQMSYEDVNIGICATPQVIKSYFNFSLGIALSDLYGNNHEKLLMPRSDLPNATYINRYAEVTVEDDYSETRGAHEYYGRHPNYFVEILPNGQGQALEIPKLIAPKLKVLDGWLENTFRYGRTGEVTFTIKSAPTVTANVVYHLPAPPCNDGMVIRNAYKYTGSALSGKAIPRSSLRTASNVSLVFGKAGYSASDGAAVVALNIERFFLQDSEELQMLEDSISEYSYGQLAFASTMAGVPMEYETTQSFGGVTIETFDTSPYGYAISWQDGLFYNATIDPTTIDNILIPLNSATTKIDGAYRYALHVAAPLSSKVRYIDQTTLNEPSRNDGFQSDGSLASYTPSFTMMLSAGVPTEISDSFKYKLEDIDIPSFILSNQADQVYDTWSSIFSYIIYGDLDGFKTSHGIDESVEIGGSYIAPEIASGDVMQLGTLNWRQVRHADFPERWHAHIPAPIVPGENQQRGFAVGLFRDDIPYYPGQEPLNGDPIFINFSELGNDFVANLDSYSAIEEFREAVRPSTNPI